MITFQLDIMENILFFSFYGVVGVYQTLETLNKIKSTQ